MIGWWPGINGCGYERAHSPIGTLTDRVQLRWREMVVEDEAGHGVLYVPIASASGAGAQLVGAAG
ncbi:hypothetical protein N8D56_21725 [Devosia sp. A8/3-2]|nr:hypothetical protein N8D56_21725 [Devosia sp. A8/3-2]